MIRPPESFATERLVARRPREADAGVAFAAYAGDPEVTRFLLWRNYTELDPLRKFLRDMARKWTTDKDRHYAWMLCPRGTDLPIGSAGVRFDVHGAMLGYVLSRAYWGRGLMTEAVSFIAAWALAQPQIWRVWAFCDVENAASARVLEKAGLIREGILRRWHVCPTIGPEPRDCFVYAKTR